MVQSRDATPAAFMQVEPLPLLLFEIMNACATLIDESNLWSSISLYIEKFAKTLLHCAVNEITIYSRLECRLYTQREFQ